MRTRRDFLKGSLAVGLGAALAPLAKMLPAEQPTEKVIPAGTPPIKTLPRPTLPYSAVASGDYIDITTFGDVNRTYLVRQR